MVKVIPHYELGENVLALYGYGLVRRLTLKYQRVFHGPAPFAPGALAREDLRVPLRLERGIGLCGGEIDVAGVVGVEKLGEALVVLAAHRIPTGELPEAMLGAEPLDLIQFDIGVLGLRHGGAREPPVGPGQAGGHVGACARPPMLPGAAGTGEDFAVRGFPHPGQISLLPEDDGVVPAPDHRLGAVRGRRNGHQVAG